MKIHLALYASLMHLLPPGKERHTREIQVAAGTTVQDVLDTWHIPPEMAHIVLVNGVFVCEQRDQHVLQAGDVVSVWPPVAGG